MAVILHGLLNAATDLVQPSLLSRPMFKMCCPEILHGLDLAWPPECSRGSGATIFAFAADVCTTLSRDLARPLACSSGSGATIFASAADVCTALARDLARPLAFSSGSCATIFAFVVDVCTALFRDPATPRGNRTVSCAQDTRRIINSKEGSHGLLQWPHFVMPSSPQVIQSMSTTNCWHHIHRRSIFLSPATCIQSRVSPCPNIFPVGPYFSGWGIFFRSANFFSGSMYIQLEKSTGFYFEICRIF